MSKVKLTGKVFSVRGYLLGTGKHENGDRNWGDCRIMLALDVPFGLDANYAITNGNDLRECVVTVDFLEEPADVATDEDNESETVDSSKADDVPISVENVDKYW